MTVHQRIDEDRAEAARVDISEGLFQYLLDAIDSAEKLEEQAAKFRDGEAKRVAEILRRDRVEAAADRRREQAELEVADGRLASLSDATIGPTPEQLEKGAFRSYTVDKHEGSVRQVTTLRRVLVDRLLQLHSRGVLDDDQLAACVWYRRQWESTGFADGPQTSKFSLAPGGRPRRDHLPPTEAAWEAWQMFRFARDGIPADVRKLFDLVVLDEFSLKEAARVSRCGFASASGAFIRAALALHGCISHLLPVRSM